MDPFDPEFVPEPARDAIVTSSLAGKVVGWSRGAVALLGWREREILGRPLEELVHETHRAGDVQTVAEVAAGHRVRDAMVKLVRRDGAVLDCLQSALPLRDATGRVTAVVRVVFDLSGLREAERALRRVVAQLRDRAPGPVGTSPAGSAAADDLRGECERARDRYLQVVEREARRIAVDLGDELAMIAAAARAARPDAFAVA